MLCMYNIVIYARARARIIMYIFIYIFRFRTLHESPSVSVAAPGENNVFRRLNGVEDGGRAGFDRARRPRGKNALL